MPCMRDRDFSQVILNEAAASTVITGRSQHCNAPDSIAEQLYGNPPPDILLLECCDALNGCCLRDARTRCGFWPGFAHPRWLTCGELYSRI